MYYLLFYIHLQKKFVLYKNINYYYFLLFLLYRRHFQCQIDAFVHFYIHNHDLFFCMKLKALSSLSQPPLNAQMMAQRQRELYSFQHRQRQLLQQKVMLMRQGMNTGPLGAQRVPKGPQQQQPPPQQQQFGFPPGYNAVPGNTPTSPSHFNPMGGPLDPSCLLGEAWETKALWEAFKGSLGGL